MVDWERQAQAQSTHGEESLVYSIPVSQHVNAKDRRAL